MTKPSRSSRAAAAQSKISPINTAQQASPLARAKARLGLPDELELSEALSAIRRALDNQWLLEAEVLARFVLLNRPEEPNAWALRGEAALADNDPASARVYFHEALRSLAARPAVEDLRRQRHLYWRAIAEANTRLNRRDEAEAALIEAARFDPNAKVKVTATDAKALLGRAYPLILQNRLDEAEPLLRAVLEHHPENADAWQGLAVLEHKRGNHDAALAAIDRALELDANNAGYWNNRGVLLKPLGAPRLAERIAAYQRATALNPGFKEAYSNLADALTSDLRFDEAAAALDKALALDPNYLGAAINRVNLLKAQGEKKAALAQIDAILETTRHPEALNLKGALLLETGDAHKAVAVLEEARSLDGRNASILNNLGNAYLATARAGKAIECYRSAVLLAPGMAEAQANLALALLTQIQHGAPRGEYLALAKNHLAIAQNLNPKLPQLFVAEGILKSQHEHDRDAAQAAYEKALALQPESVQALSGLAGLYADMGERKKARELLKRAYELAPDDADIATSYIFALNYDPDSTPEEIHQAALSYGRHIQARVGAPYTDWPNARAPNKRLKIGFVSGDFRRHPVAYFCNGLFEHLPREEVEVYAYHNHIASDDMTARIKAAVDHWRVIADMSVDAACELIRADGIDILIDLSGHTGYHRLDVFAKKPAPVSVSWLGFITTTGIHAVDYFAADAVILNETTTAAFIERPLPFYHWAPLPGEIPEFDSYAKQGDAFRFGSFNNVFKYNDAVFDLWAEILRQAPDATLLLKDRRLSDSAVAKRFHERFVAKGIAKERIELVAAVPSRHDHFDYYRQMDLALDPFPTGGAATTIEALAMGVPTLSWIYQTSRASCYFTASTARLLGIEETTVAKTRDEYIEKALAFYRTPGLLDRSTLAAATRELLKPARFAAEFSVTLRDAWRRHAA